jgi:tetratricopeptide (TPR) repeat protein
MHSNRSCRKLNVRGDSATAVPGTPQYSVLLINLAIAEDATKQSAAAEQHFKDALRLAPASPDSYTYYARYLLWHSRGEEARGFLRSAVELSPSDLTRANFWRKQMVRQPINRRRKRRSLTSLSASSVMARSDTRNRSLPVELLSNSGRITPKPGTTSAPLTTSSVATRKPPPPVRRRFILNPISNWPEIISSTRVKWRKRRENSEQAARRRSRPFAPQVESRGQSTRARICRKRTAD